MKDTPICVKRRDAVAHHGAGVFQAWLQLRNSCRPSEATHGQAAERRCMADFQSLSPGPHSAVTAQITLASDARTCFVPAGSASVSLPSRLCTWLPASYLQLVSHFNSRRWLCSSTTSALVTPHTVGSTIGDHTFPVTCIGLEQFAGVSPVIAVVASSLQQTENWTFCPVLQTWLRTSHCADYYYVTSLFKLIVTCPCSLRT